MHGVLCLGEVLVDLIAQEIGTGLQGANTFVKAAGGAVANTAVGVARLGGRVSFAGQVGADAFGRFLRGHLEAEGVDTRWLRFSSDHPTGVVFVSLDSDRVPSFCFYGTPSADMMYGPDQVEPAMLAGVGFVHFGTVSMVRPESRDATWKLVGLARERGVKVSFDPNLRLHLWRDHGLLKETARRAAAMSHLVKLNRDELHFLTGDDDLAAGAKKLLTAGPDAVVVTLGPEGAYYRTRETEGTTPGFAVATEDTTGAGDAFAAGLLAALTGSAWPPDGETMKRAVLRANACGALATMATGATAGLPRLPELERFLASAR